MGFMNSMFGGADAENSQYKDRDQLMKYINQGMGQGGIAHMNAPQILSDPDSQFRGAQLGAVHQLSGVLAGGKGAGELAAERQFQNANAAQQAMARSARGTNSALAYRNAANQTAANGATAAGAGQQAALLDRQSAAASLGNLSNAGRAGDFSLGNANAGYQQQTNGLNSQNYLGLMGSLGTMDANQLQAVQAAQANHGLAGGLLNAAGQVAAAYVGGPMAAAKAAEGGIPSDERIKTNVTDARDSVDQLMDSMSPKGFAYKEPAKFGPGMSAGVMAQDLERSDAGKDMVQETPDGKSIDMKKAVAAALAATARLNERLRAVEKR